MCSVITIVLCANDVRRRSMRPLHHSHLWLLIQTKATPTHLYQSLFIIYKCIYIIYYHTYVLIYYIYSLTSWSGSLISYSGTSPRAPSWLNIITSIIQYLESSLSLLSPCYFFSFYCGQEYWLNEEQEKRRNIDTSHVIS